MQMSPPKKVETPFPPLNLNQMGNICPRIAARRATEVRQGRSGAKAIAKAPFAASPKKVPIPSIFPPTRQALVAPIFPEPCARISPCPKIFPRRTPTGIEPTRYPIRQVKKIGRKWTKKHPLFPSTLLSITATRGDPKKKL